ncbi:MAG TPA: hypothetical protein VJJ75_01860 [Candidatus Nanoarchaeia archaeon]|nr:hypothetical protein [Candidatus Nanoarchaeia archaeon]
MSKDKDEGVDLDSLEVGGIGMNDDFEPGKPVCEMSSPELDVTEQRKDLESTLDAIAMELQPTYQGKILREYSNYSIDHPCKFPFGVSSFYSLVEQRKNSLLSRIAFPFSESFSCAPILEIADYTLELPDKRQLIPVNSYASTVEQQAIIARHLNAFAERWKVVIPADAIPHLL